MSAQIKVDDLFFVRDRTLTRLAKVDGHSARAPEVRSSTVELFETFSPFPTEESQISK